MLKPQALKNLIVDTALNPYLGFVRQQISEASNTNKNAVDLRGP